MDTPTLAFPNRLSKWKFPVFIYGTGIVGRDLWKLPKAKGYVIKGLIGHRITPSPFSEIITYLSDDKRISLEKWENLSLVIAIHNRSTQIHHVIENLRRLGYRKNHYSD